MARGTVVPSEDAMKESTSQQGVTLPFENRREAGRLLGRILKTRHAHEDVIVLALPRGGLPVANEVSVALGAPLDIIVVRKLGVPWQPELAMGAIAGGDTEYLNQSLLRSLGLKREEVRAVEARERVELRRRELAYRGEHPRPEIAGKTVIIVDDGLATGATMFAAVKAVRRENPARVVVAVPVAPTPTLMALQEVAEEVICPAQPRPFSAVGACYRDFSQVSEEEVQEILSRSWAG